MAKRRMNFWMDEEVHAKIKEYADKNGISVAGAISVLCSYGLDTMATIKMSGQLMSNPEFLDYVKLSAELKNND